MYIWFFEIVNGVGTHVQIIVADTEQEARSYLQLQDTTWRVASRVLNKNGYITTVIE